jgi:hypothetical protein
MYVINGPIDGIKDILKSYGMKWVRKLKGCPGYVLYVNNRAGFDNLYTIKRIIRENNKREKGNLLESTDQCCCPVIQRSNYCLVWEYISLWMCILLIHVMVVCMNGFISTIDYSKIDKLSFDTKRMYSRYNGTFY